MKKEQMVEEKEKDNRTISLPSEFVRRIDERNKNRSAQITEELGYLYSLYEKANIKSKFTDRELSAMTQKLLAVNFESLVTRVPVKMLIKKMFGPGSPEGVGEGVATKVEALTDIEVFALADELRLRYWQEKRVGMRHMLAMAAAGDGVEKKRRRRA